MIKRLPQFHSAPRAVRVTLSTKRRKRWPGGLNCPFPMTALPCLKIKRKVRRFTEETLVVFGMPTYAGRVPNKALPF